MRKGSFSLYVSLSLQLPQFILHHTGNETKVKNKMSPQRIQELKFEGFIGIDLKVQGWVWIALELTLTPPCLTLYGIQSFGSL